MYDLASKEVTDMAEVIIKKDHEHLLDAKITYLFREEAWKKGDGRTILGKAAKRNEIDRLLSNRREDFIVILVKPKWDKMTEEQKRCLIDHELCHCLISPRIPVFTLDGWCPISKVLVGDKVLTHLGRFQKVTKIFKSGGKSLNNLVTLTLERKDKSITLTDEHPVLIDGKWKKAKEIKKGEHLKFLAHNCRNCENIVPIYKDFCSISCQRSFFSKELWKDENYKKMMSAAVTNANKKRRGIEQPKVRERLLQLVEQGKHPFQQAENIKKNLSNLGKRNYGKTWSEEKLGWQFAQLNLKPKPQFPIEKGTDKAGNKRYYFPDFAFPKEKIAVEIDGNFHSYPNRIKSDQIRQKFLEDLGWQFIRFTPKEIKTDLLGCATKVLRLTLNHNNEYKFVDLKIKSVKHWKSKTLRYNLEIENDNSYIAKGGYVVHNCGVMVTNSGEKKWILRSHPIEEFPENLARFAFRREALGNLIEHPPCAIVTKVSKRNIRPV